LKIRCFNSRPFRTALIDAAAAALCLCLALLLRKIAAGCWAAGAAACAATAAALYPLNRRFVYRDAERTPGAGRRYALCAAVCASAAPAVANPIIDAWGGTPGHALLAACALFIALNRLGQRAYVRAEPGPTPSPPARRRPWPPSPTARSSRRWCTSPTASSPAAPEG